MGEVIKMPEEEPQAFVCDYCAEWDLKSSAFFIYEDATFRCVECGNSWNFEEDVQPQTKKKGPEK